MASTWVAVAGMFCLTGCHRSGYELNRQPLKLSADRSSVTLHLREIVDTHEIGLWSAEFDAANEILAQMDVQLATVAANVGGENWTFVPFKLEEHKGFGASLPGNVPLGYVTGNGSATLTIPLTSKHTLDEAILNKTEAVVFVSPRQSGL